MTLRDYLFEKILCKSEYNDDFIITNKNDIVIETGSHSDIITDIRTGELLTDEVLELSVYSERSLVDNVTKRAYNIVALDTTKEY